LEDGVIDDLTNVYNYRYFADRLADESSAQPYANRCP
jgi:PleD family two-component response regulator